MARLYSSQTEKYPPGFIELSCGIPLRINNIAAEEIHTAAEVRSDWVKYVSPNIDAFRGTEGSLYPGGTSVGLPEVPPERFHSLCYISELWLLIDGMFQTTLGLA